MKNIKCELCDKFYGSGTPIATDYLLTDNNPVAVCEYHKRLTVELFAKSKIIEITKEKYLTLRTFE